MQIYGPDKQAAAHAVAPGLQFHQSRENPEWLESNWVEMSPSQNSRCPTANVSSQPRSAHDAYAYPENFAVSQPSGCQLSPEQLRDPYAVTQGPGQHQAAPYGYYEPPRTLAAPGGGRSGGRNEASYEYYEPPRTLAAPGGGRSEGRDEAAERGYFDACCGSERRKAPEVYRHEVHAPEYEMQSPESRSYAGSRQHGGYGGDRFAGSSSGRGHDHQGGCCDDHESPHQDFQQKLDRPTRAPQTNSRGCGPLPEDGKTHERVTTETYKSKKSKQVLVTTELHQRCKKCRKCHKLRTERELEVECLKCGKSKHYSAATEAKYP